MLPQARIALRKSYDNTAHGVPAGSGYGAAKKLIKRYPAYSAHTVFWRAGHPQIAAVACVA